jgi:NADH-quinone oxidoreductase subunit J
MAVDILITILTVIFALMVVFSKRTVVSAFALLMNLLCIAAIYFQLGSNFLAAVQILVNAGAIAILFIFVMMLINLDQFSNNREKSKLKLIISTFTMLVAMGVITMIINNNIDTLTTNKLVDNSMNALFAKLFDSYYLPFELATMLLLGAVVAVVVLTGHYKVKSEE